MNDLLQYADRVNPIVRVPIWCYDLDREVFVDIDLHNGLLQSSGGPDEEGHFHKDEEFYMRADGSVIWEQHSTWRDCDGKGERRTAHLWNVADQMWEQISHSQRDYTAESMGY
jgi:hypothetical protein